MTASPSAPAAPPGQSGGRASGGHSYRQRPAALLGPPPGNEAPRKPIVSVAPASAHPRRSPVPPLPDPAGGIYAACGAGRRRASRLGRPRRSLPGRQDLRSPRTPRARSGLRGAAPGLPASAQRRPEPSRAIDHDDSALDALDRTRTRTTRVIRVPYSWRRAFPVLRARQLQPCCDPRTATVWTRRKDRGV